MIIRRTVPVEIYENIKFYIMDKEARISTQVDMVWLINEYHKWFGDLNQWKVIERNDANNTVVIRGSTSGIKRTDKLVPEPEEKQ